MHALCGALPLTREGQPPMHKRSQIHSAPCRTPACVACTGCAVSGACGTGHCRVQERLSFGTRPQFLGPTWLLAWCAASAAGGAGYARRQCSHRHIWKVSEHAGVSVRSAPGLYQALLQHEEPAATQAPPTLPQTLLRAVVILQGFLSLRTLTALQSLCPVASCSLAGGACRAAGTAHSATGTAPRAAHLQGCRACFHAVPCIFIAM